MSPATHRKGSSNMTCFLCSNWWHSFDFEKSQAALSIPKANGLLSRHLQTWLPKSMDPESLSRAGSPRWQDGNQWGVGADPRYTKPFALEVFQHFGWFFGLKVSNPDAPCNDYTLNTAILFSALVKVENEQNDHFGSKRTFQGPNTPLAMITMGERHIFHQVFDATLMHSWFATCDPMKLARGDRYKCFERMHVHVPYMEHLEEKKKTLAHCFSGLKR